MANLLAKVLSAAQLFSADLTAADPIGTLTAPQHDLALSAVAFDRTPHARAWRAWAWVADERAGVRARGPLAQPAAHLATGVRFVEERDYLCSFAFSAETTCDWGVLVLGPAAWTCPRLQSALFGAL